MRIADFVITAAAVAGLSGTALAQTPATTPPVPTNPVANTSYNSTDDHWIASAFVGSNFGSGRTDNLTGLDVDSSSTSINFGGQAAYLWGGYVGAEALVDFAPSFAITNLLFQDNPSINTYMANGIVAAPIGSEDRFLPYFSGGVGAVQMRSTIFAIDPATASGPALATLTADGSRFGGNVGGGIMGFSGSWGFRGDLRYYKTSVDNNIDLTDFGNGNVFTQSVLSGLAFWKANVGVAFRW